MDRVYISFVEYYTFALLEFTGSCEAGHARLGSPRKNSLFRTTGITTSFKSYTFDSKGALQIVLVRNAGDILSPSLCEVEIFAINHGLAVVKVCQWRKELYFPLYQNLHLKHCHG